MATFDHLDALGDAIGRVYADCTDRLLVNLARHFMYLKPGEEPGGSFQWQARKLAELGQVNRENLKIIRSMMGGIVETVEHNLERAILDALADVEPALRQAAEAGLLGTAPLSEGGGRRPGGVTPLPEGGVTPPAELDPRQMTAFTLYRRQAVEALNLVNSTMLQSTAEAYRGMVSDITNRMAYAQATVNKAAGEVLSGAESFNSALKIATRRLMAAGLTGFVDQGGHNWQPDTWVAMTMRSTYHNVSREAFWERNGDYANDLYLVSQHPGARPLCYPWQCKVISRTDNAREVPDGDGNPVHVYAQSETTFGEPAGLFGINCGHHPMLFIPGASKVPALQQSESENARTYAQSQKQRKLERDFRKARREYEAARAQGAPDAEQTRTREKFKAADAKLSQFERDTGRRRRREREYAP